MRKLLTLALVSFLAMTQTGCSAKACKVYKVTASFVNSIVRPAFSLLIPVLAPGVAGEYSVLQAAADSAGAAIGDACARDKVEAEDVVKATDAAVRLIEFYRQNKPSAEQVERVLTARGLPLPRSMGGDPTLTLLAAAGQAPVEKQPSAERILAELAELRAEAAKQ